MMKSLDRYLALITSPLLKEIPGSLIDTGALLRDINKIANIGAGAQLYSADVESLYPSIPWSEGLKSATRFYSRHLDKLKERARREKQLMPPQPDIFRAILKLILENNIFHFQDGHWFWQRKGTAMGCSMTVFFTNTFMYERTQRLISNPPPKLIYLGRYIDDIIAVYAGSGEEFEALFTGSTEETIKITFVHGDKELDALDERLRIENVGTISTRLYRKPTEGHQYLHWSSSYPPSHSPQLHVRRRL